MSSIFDMYLKDSIISECEKFFNDYLKDEGVPEEGLTEGEWETIDKQVDYLIKIIQNIYAENENEVDALTEIVDKFMGLCIVSKMNEARLCRILNKKEN